MTALSMIAFQKADRNFLKHSDFRNGGYQGSMRYSKQSSAGFPVRCGGDAKIDRGHLPI